MKGPVLGWSEGVFSPGMGGECEGMVGAFPLGGLLDVQVAGEPLQSCLLGPT